MHRRVSGIVCGSFILATAIACSVVACGGDGDDASTTPSTQPGTTKVGSCDLAADPKDSPSCVDDAIGVFVDGAHGDDANAGSRLLPVKTFTAALEKLAGRTRIYACGEGPYAESIRITEQNTTSLYGGFDCASWAYNGTKVQIAPPGPGFALGVSSATNAIVVSDLVLTSKTDPAPGASSIAVLGYQSGAITLRRVSIHAGNGSDGTDASAQPAFSPAAPPNGNSGAQGGATTANPTCPTSIGGKGGRDGSKSGGDGLVADPENPGGIGGGPASQCGDDFSLGSKSLTGANGAAGAAGAAATVAGVVDGPQWRGADGLAGGAGRDGQGGGGGAQISAGNVGGGGGPGGCGGHGGDPGRGAGSSIGILALGTAFTLDHTDVTVGSGGRGGNGGKGQAGQTHGGGSPGTGSNLNACSGSPGGYGGSGGGGGGGSGGVSAGIVQRGAPVTIDGVRAGFADTSPVVTLGQPGAGGAGGAGGDATGIGGFLGDPIGHAGMSGASGRAGEAKAIMELE